MQKFKLLIINPITLFLLLAFFLSINFDWFNLFTENNNSFVFNTQNTIITYTLSFLFFIIQGCVITIFLSKRKFIYIFVSSLMIFIYLFLYIYTITTSYLLDFSFLLDFIFEVRQNEFLEMVYIFLPSHHIVIAVIILILSICYLLYYSNNILSSFNCKYKNGGILVITLFILALPNQNSDLLLNLYKSIYNHFSIKLLYGYNTDSKKKLIDCTENNNTKIDNVIILMLESCNSNYIDKFDDILKKEITPTLNKLRKNSIYIEKFYANSVGTARGTFSTLTGLTPGYRGKTFRRNDTLNHISIPKIFKKNNFETIFGMAYKDINFDNTGPYMQSLGFDYVYSGVDFQNNDNKNKFWGFGMQDDFFYDSFFSKLDSLNNLSEKKRLILLQSISHHSFYSSMPDSQKFIYEKPTNRVQNYINSMHLEDKYLDKFINEFNKREYLKNTLLVILGDHSSTPDEEMWTGNRSGIFKTPCYFINSGLENKIIKNGNYSQIDILPSIIDLLDFDVDEKFLGNSIFCEKYEKESVAYCIQPYYGVSLNVIKDSIQFSLHIATGNEFVFNINKDPDCNNNIIQSTNNLDLEYFRQKINEIILNQSCIEENKF